MTRSSTIKHVGWMAALLAVCVLSMNADAGSKQRGQKKSGQQKRHVQKKNNNKQRARASQPRQARDAKKADRRREPQREARRDRTQRDTNRKAARDEREARQRRTQREEKHRQEREAQARASKRATQERGANWGVNAQRKKLGERQATVRHQEQKVVQKRQAERHDLRVAKQRFDNKVQRTNHVLYRRDQRLDTRADALRRGSHRRPVVIHKPVVVNRSRHGKKHYGHGVLRNHDRYNRHNNYGNFGLSFIFGNASYFHYEYGYRRHHCCTGGYYIWQWEPPLEVTRYDEYSDPYTVVIRAGYYHRVWIPHYCRYSRHHYYRY